MVTRATNQITQSIGTTPKWKVYPVSIEERSDPRISPLLKDLTQHPAWPNRQIAAKKLGYLRIPDAVPGLLAALKIDNFWMVRCAIIQALELIGDSRSIPTLREVANRDSFQAVRSYAAKAVERLI